jgi:16S rRNA C1402 N4-methylase RsmH
MNMRRNESVVDDLQELIAALDRRVPRLERAGEHPIARAAAALRIEATNRIAELEQSPLGGLSASLDGSGA